VRDAKLLNETVRVFRIAVLPGMPFRLREFRKTTVRPSNSFVAVNGEPLLRRGSSHTQHAFIIPGGAVFMEKEATGRSLDGHAPSAMAEPLVIRESDVSLVEDSKPPGFCRGLAFDWSHSLEDSHTLVFAVALLISCSLDNITQAKASALEWRTNPWVCRFCFMYFPAVAHMRQIPWACGASHPRVRWPLLG
jgi:hypothetical protein